MCPASAPSGVCGATPAGSLTDRTDARKPRPRPCRPPRAHPADTPNSLPGEWREDEHTHDTGRRGLAPARQAEAGEAGGGGAADPGLRNPERERTVAGPWSAGAGTPLSASTRRQDRGVSGPFPLAAHSVFFWPKLCPCLV